MTHDEIIAVVQAHKEGKKIEARERYLLNAHWIKDGGPCWNFETHDYRIAPPNPVEVWVSQFPSGGKCVEFEQPANLDTLRRIGCRLLHGFLEEVQ